MPFVRRFHTLLKSSNQNIIINNLDHSLKMQNFDYNFNLISSKKLLDGSYSFVDVWFDINEDNTIYGVINAYKNSILYLYINDKVIIRNTLLKYDPNEFNIQFLYIKNKDCSTHIIYYLIDKCNINQCTLIHYYRERNSWVKKQIDTVQYNILTNFVVIFENSTPTIFYLKVINGYEELFVSTFDLDNKVWTTPIQITNSHKFKVYLSVIKCSNGSYRITYSENNSNKYYCSYINVFIDKNAFNIINNKIISETIACTFPIIIEHKQILYIQWIEFNTLYYCVSYDFGNNWTEPILDRTSSNHDFNCYSYKSITSDNNEFNNSVIFAQNEPFNILGIIK